MNRYIAVTLMITSAALFRTPIQAQETSPETWEFHMVPGGPIGAQLPKDGTVNYRGDDLLGHRDMNLKWPYQDITLEQWPDNMWHNMIRFGYEKVENLSSWDYALRHPSGFEVEKPVIKKRRGHRVYEVIESIPATSSGDAFVNVTYRMELDQQKFFEIQLSCSKPAFRKYAAYYSRIRDTLELAPTKR